MKRASVFLALLLSLSLTDAGGQSAADRGKAHSDNFARVGRMRVVFKGAFETFDPETKTKAFAVSVAFLDLPIPGGPLILRVGDRVAGYEIARYIHREPKIGPTDGVVAGTLPTLEILHLASGERFSLEPHDVEQVPRDPIPK